MIVGNNRQRLISAGVITIIWLCSYVLPQSTTTQNQAINVSLLQGNIPQSIKWDPEQALKTIQLYYQMTLMTPPQSLVIWPEAAIPVSQDLIPEYLTALERLSQLRQSAILTGIPVRKNDAYYNGVMIIGEGHGTYLKQHLVPFGEFYPLQWALHGIFDYLQIPMSDLSAGPSNQPKLEAFGHKIAIFICYEIAYPQFALNMSQDAEILVTVSDDSWFGNSNAASQHLEIAQMRALETGRYLIFSTNGGISAIVGPDGQLLEVINNIRAAVHGQVYAVNGQSYLMRWGYSPIFMLTSLLLIIGLAQRRITRL
jgi:apolipoprotein N-acyltransferase